MKDATLSGRPAMSEARRQHVYGKIVPLIEDDAVWQPAYRSMVALVCFAWGVAGVLALIDICF